jgi:predicted Co/Zn/Cd cation transporter (cation efflux family)
VNFENRMFAGGLAMFLAMYFVSTRLYDALGGNDRSLAIGLGIAVAVGSAIGVATIQWARRAKR